MDIGEVGIGDGADTFSEQIIKLLESSVRVHCMETLVTCAEVWAFFQRNIEAGRRAGQMPRTIDAAEVSAHLLGVLLGIRVLARTRPERALLEGIARPALALLKKARSEKARGQRR